MKCPDNFYEDVKYIKAHKFASEYINNLLYQSPDFEWIKRETENNSFDDMSFRYKNTMFSVLLKVFYRQNLLNSYIDRELDWVNITDENNFFPIVFPVKVVKIKNSNTYECYSLMEGLNFWDWMSTDTFNIMDIASDN